MEQEKLYVIEEKTYEAHIDEEVHLYGLLHQLAFLAGKVKDRRDMENLIDTARWYGEIADQMFDRWSIRPLPGFRRQGRPCPAEGSGTVRAGCFLCGL